MSFLIDPPLLYSGGRTYARATQDLQPSAGRDLVVGVAYMAVFWGISIGLYLDQGWTRPVWKMCRAIVRTRLDAQLGRVQIRLACRRTAHPQALGRHLRDLSPVAVVGDAARATVAV